MGSYLEIYLDKITHNASVIRELCHKNGIKLFAVTKVFCAEEKIVKSFINVDIDGLADSRIENLKILKNMNTGLPLMLLRLPELSIAKEVVEYSDLSLNSEIKTLKALDKNAKKLGKRHKVIIMFDVGDLREGVWPDNAENFFEDALKLKNIDIVGIGTNTACFGGVIPSPENMGTLVEIRDNIQKVFGIELPIISGGNSSALRLLKSGKMPREINNFRIGEAIVLGRDVIDRSPFPDTVQDTFILNAEIIELKVKPSVPIGERGQNAFGEEKDFPQRGEILRAILAIGRQDADIEGLTPVDKDVEILGASSDHLIVELKNNNSGYSVGEYIQFYPDYGCLLALMTSKYIEKRYIN